MTNEELLAKIKAEIERRMTENCELGKKAECFSHRSVEDNDILALIDSLQQEEQEKSSKKNCNNCPYCIDRKDHKTGRHFRRCFGGQYKEGKPIAKIDECPLQQEQPEVDLEKAALNFGEEIGVPVSNTFMSIARHFAQWGAEHSGSSEIPEDLEEAADLFSESPELRESEDERIRKELLALINKLVLPNEQRARFNIYLEKQKYEYEVFEPIENTLEYKAGFKAGIESEKQKKQKSLNISAASEWLRKHVRNYMNSEYNEFHRCVEFDGSIDEERLVNDFEEVMQKEQKPADISSLRDWKYIVDAVLTEHEGIGQYLDKPETERIAKKLQERFSLPQSKPAEWSQEYREEDLRTRFAFYTYKDEYDVLYLSNVFVEKASRNKGFGTKILKAAEKVAETIGAISIRLKVKQNSPANDWYRRRGYGYMAFEGEYDWLEKTLEYLKPRPKVEYSEEDEKRIRQIERIVRRAGCTRKLQEEIHDWLKSRRPSWKPSEEQMDVLLWCTKHLGEEDRRVLAELYEHLKKLM